MMRNKIEIVSIQSRPNFLPFTVILGRNDTSPKVSLSQDSVLIRVFFSNRVAYNTIRKIELERGHKNNDYAIVKSTSWDYIIHPKSPKDLLSLFQQFKGRDVPLGPLAEQYLEKEKP